MKNMKIRSQLVLAFAAVLAVVLISSIVVFMMASDVSQKLDRFQGLRIPALLLSSNVSLDLMKSRSDVRQVLLFVSVGNMEEAKGYKQKVVDDWSATDAAFAKLQLVSEGFVVPANKDKMAKLATELPLAHQQQTEITEAALAAGPRRLHP